MGLKHRLRKRMAVDVGVPLVPIGSCREFFLPVCY